MMQLYRLLAGIAAALVLVQAILAGQGMGGNVGIFEIHGLLGSGTFLLAALLVGMSFLGLRQGLFDAKPLVITLALVVLVTAQLGLGYVGTSVVAIHVPLGVLIFGVLLTLFVSVLPMRLAPASSRTS